MKIPNELRLPLIEHQTREEIDRIADELAARSRHCLLPSRLSEIAAGGASAEDRQHLEQCRICPRVLAGYKAASRARVGRRGALLARLDRLVPSLEPFFEHWIALARQNAGHLTNAARYSTPPKPWEIFQEGDYRVCLEIRKPLSRFVVSVDRDDDGGGERVVVVALVGKKGAELNVSVRLRARRGAVLSGSAVLSEEVGDVLDKLGTIIVPVVRDARLNQE